MAFVIEIEEVNAQTVGALDGQLARLPGFVLALTGNSTAGDEFLLGSYVGTCIHTPPPQPTAIYFWSMAAALWTSAISWRPAQSRPTIPKEASPALGCQSAATG